MSHVRPLIAALIFGALLALAGPATAAPTVAEAAAAPADPKAGASADFTVDFKVDGLGATAGGDDLKSLRLDLPPGLVGNPLATGGTCTKEQLAADACPASTKVGTTTTVADVIADGLTQTITGDIYNLVVAGAEAARLGIVLRPAGGLLPKVFLESAVNLRASDGGLTSTVEDIPRTAAGTDLAIRRMTLTLLGKLDSGKAFMNNPTSCAPASTTITVGTYDGQTATGTGGFTPTACDALPFGPQISAALGPDRAALRPGGKPAMTVTVTQQPGEANSKSVAVKLPSGIGANIAGLSVACPLATYQAGACAQSAVVGSGEAASPLLASPLTGTVTLVSDPAETFPQLRVALRGAFPVDLIGHVALGSDGRLLNTFDGIYDVPLSRFVLTINGGPTALLTAGTDLCAAGTTTLDGTFVAHSGKQATASAAATTVGCDTVRPARLRARLGRLKAGRPALHVHAISPDRALTLLRLRLPKGLAFTKRAKAKSRVTLKGQSAPVTVRLRKGRLEVTLASGGSPDVDVVVRRGGVRVSRKLRRARHPKLGKLRADTQLADRPVTHAALALKLVAKP
jgi:hypothetical protein